MNDQVIVIVSLVLLAVFAVIFLYVYVYSLRGRARDQWGELLAKLGERLDKIPNLIETMRTKGGGQEVLVKDLIELREKAWPTDGIGKERVHIELEVTARLRDVWKVAGEVPDLARDTNYLELRMEFKDVAEEIEKVVEEFNAKVRRYNETLAFILLRPFTLLMGFRRLPVFEFEPS